MTSRDRVKCNTFIALFLNISADFLFAKKKKLISEGMLDISWHPVGEVGPRHLGGYYFEL